MKPLAAVGAGLVCVGAGLASVLAASPHTELIGGYLTSLAGRSHSQRHNAALAMARLDGAAIGPGGTFSFNARVGTCSRDRGYRRAPVSYNGQLLDSWGGGVCQVSTTLYNAALLAGLDIVERHRHRSCPSYVPPGLDAAVAFDTLDLKVRNPYAWPVLVHAKVAQDSLKVWFTAPRQLKQPPIVSSRILLVTPPEEVALGEPEVRARVRNSGRPGYDVEVFRTNNGVRELVSADSYPPMHRVVEYDEPQYGQGSTDERRLP